MSIFKIDPIKSSVKMEINENEILIWPEAEEESVTYSKNKPVVILSLKRTITEKEAWQLTYLLSEYLESISFRNAGYENVFD